MNIVLIIIMVEIILGILAILLGSYTIVTTLRENQEILKKILSSQLNPRTRMGRATPQTGMPNADHDLARLGRLSAGSRVVVGGDAESELNQRLTGRGGNPNG